MLINGIIQTNIGITLLNVLRNMNMRQINVTVSVNKCFKYG